VEIFTSLRDGSWLTPRRVKHYPILIVIVAAIALPVMALLGPADRAPLGVDFVATWAAGHVALAGGDAYDPEQLRPVEQAAIGGTKFYPYPYPPTYRLLTEWVGALPYHAGLILWEILGVAAFMGAMMGLTGGRGFWLAVAFPGLIVNVINGQNGLWLASALAFALAFLARRSLPSGAMIGLLSVKPHLGLMIPFALGAGRYWRCFLAAAVTVVGLGALSIAFFGLDPWRSFFGTLEAYRTGLMQGDDPAIAKLVSPFAHVRRTGAGLAAAYGVQAIIALFALGSVIKAWRSAAPLGIKQAVLVIAGLLATPYLFDYDMALLAPAIALATLVGLEEGFGPWEKTLLAFLWVLPGIARPIAVYTGLPIVPVGLALGLVILMSRVRHATR
jgi:alpha-1,2-mannosyltransferase